MKQAFKEAWQEMGSSGSGKTAHFTFILGNKVLYDGIVEADKEYRAQIGKSAFAQ
jgi:ABC-type transporter Mla maintaining outer membrane lipid asymmetry ATPase subunit MlaF